MSQPSARRENGPVTYGDYLQWTGEERWEILNGTPCNMGPAPSTKHQRVIRKLLVQIDHLLSDHPGCEVFAAPFDVRFPEGDEADEAVIQVVQPDIAVICDPSRIDEKGCRGAPDWIIEVLSPATASRDYIAKRSLYERMGVREYWLVHPLDRLVTVFVSGPDGIYAPPVFRAGTGSLSVTVLPDLALHLDLLFT